MTKTNVPLLILMLLFISDAAQSQQTIYRCKMDDGTTIFSDSPCVDQSSGRGTQEELRIPESQNILESHPRSEVRPQIQAPSRQYHPRAQPQRPHSGSSVIESRVEDEFEGWDGETIVRLDNGQIWLQAEYHYEYRYQYRPSVIVFLSGGTWKMQVEGMRRPIAVELLRD